MTFLENLSRSLYGWTKAEAHAEGRCIRCRALVSLDPSTLRSEDAAEYRITAFCPSCFNEVAAEPGGMSDPLDWWKPLTPPNRAAAPPKCRRHLWDEGVCARCGHPQDTIARRRGRLNRSRGNAIEREIGKRLGLRRVGQYGGPDDLSGDLFAAQVKSGGAFSERFWSWLKAVPVKAGQTPLLVVTDAPGPGHRRRAVVVLDLDDWEALHRGDA